MAVAIDSQESAATGHGATVSPLTWSFTNTAGTLLVVGVNLTQVTPDNTPSIGAVTYNSVAMTLLDSYTTGTPALTGDANVLAYYYLQSPATGSNTVSVAFTLNGGPVNKGIIAGAISFTGADAVSPFGTAAKNKDTTSGTATSGSVTVAGTTAGNYVIGLLNTGSGGIGVTAPSASSWILNQSTHTGGDNAALSTQAAGGSITMAYTFSADIYSAMAVEVKATSTPVSNTGIRARTRLRPAPFKPMGDAFRPGKYQGWR